MTTIWSSWVQVCCCTTPFFAGAETRPRKRTIGPPTKRSRERCDGEFAASRLAQHAGHAYDDGGILDLAPRRNAQLWRASGPDRGDTPDSGRGETLGLREPVSARLELLHALAGSGSAAACDLYRLADASHARRHCGWRPFHRAGRRCHYGAELRLRRVRQRRLRGRFVFW